VWCKRLSIRSISGAILVLAAVAQTPDPAFAFTTAPDRTRETRALAQRAEDDSQWDKAALYYEQLLASSRNSTEFRNRYQACLRRARQMHRQLDVSYREETEHLSLDSALKVYAEVLARLQHTYVDKQKAALPVLFREGLHELRNALDDPGFRRLYLGRATLDSIRAFRDDVLVLEGELEPARKEDAQSRVRAIALDAQASLALSPALVVLECACGACAGLDEYTHYLTPDQLSQMDDSWKGKTVSEPRFIHEPLGIAYFQISAFHDSTVEEVEQAIAQLQDSGMRALVLDLRGNLGGRFDVAVGVAERLLSTGVIAFTRGQMDEFNTAYRAHALSLLTVPLIVLIDTDTASSAEMLAGALKENHRATLVGQATFGKGSIQKVRKLHSVPAAIRMTVARFYSPEGHSYAERGVSPDVVVERPMATTDLDRDPQVQAALDVARPLVLDH
jgi:hypothetical protein